MLFIIIFNSHNDSGQLSSSPDFGDTNPVIFHLGMALQMVLEKSFSCVLKLPILSPTAKIQNYKRKIG